jgi:acetate kinase
MILVLNAGSSSLKFALYDLLAKQEFISGNIERIGLTNSFVSFTVKHKSYQEKISRKINNHQEALQLIFSFLVWRGYNLHTITKIGHRVVHGGGQFWQPVKLNRKIYNQLKRFEQLAPLHNPVSLQTIQACTKFFPKVNQYACFDTEWYKNMPPENFLYSLPKIFYNKYHIRQYGFHGLSHEQAALFAATSLHKTLNKLNIITCHLGAGSSITAVKQGRAIETSMGFTPLAGLSMSSRSGDVDANIPLYMIMKLKITPAKVFQILNTESGWLALAGVTDFRQIMVDTGFKIKGFIPRKKIIERNSSQLVFERFIQEISFYIAGYSSLLGTVEAVVFTGAIGMNKDFRSQIISRLSLKNTKFLFCEANEQKAITDKIKKLK